MAKSESEPGEPGEPGEPEPTEAEVKLQEFTPPPLKRSLDTGYAGAVTPFPRPAPPQEAVEHMRLVEGETSLSILCCGDLCGQVDLLHSKLLELRPGEVDFVLAVGCFFPPHEHIGRLGLYVGRESRKLPVPVYFIDNNSEVFIGKVEETRRPILLQENLSFLGSCGIAEIQGLNVAFLSGRFDPVTYKDKWGRGLFTGSNYTEAVIERLEKDARKLAQRGERVDLLLTCEWPDRIWSPEKRKWLKTMVHPDSASPAVSRLVARLRPQYHIFGTADRFSFIRGSTKSLALANARDMRFYETEEELRKWSQTLQIRPFGRRNLSGVIDVEEVEIIPCDSKRFKEEPEPDAQQTDAAAEVDADADAPRQESPEREAVAAEPPAETAAHDDDPWGKWKGGEEGREPTSPIEAPVEKDGG
ncbi:unnamed protein product [Cladocopium goreaui]|uniref:Protein kinase domain-containing protein n=1 Tax=Cladocopium goreaui TaxID=2562237 RepID=A0A9P1BMM5_9DINO|nr:unnamed protein product [Cladocopium goreaui]